MDGELAGLARVVVVEGLDDLNVLRLGTGCTGRVTKSAREREMPWERETHGFYVCRRDEPRGAVFILRVGLDFDFPPAVSTEDVSARA